MNKKFIQIREAGTGDAAQLSNLIRTAYRDVAERFQLTPASCPKHPSNCADEWIENDFERGVRYFLLEDGKDAVGCVAIEKAGNEMGYLERLAVLPQQRNRGFGHRLVKHVFQAAQQLGLKKIGIGIIARQTDLKQWYQKNGFVEGETKEFDHLPFTVCFMTYTL